MRGVRRNNSRANPPTRSVQRNVNDNSQRSGAWRVARGATIPPATAMRTRHSDVAIVQGETGESTGEVGGQQDAELGSAGQHATQADLHQSQPLQTPEIAGLRGRNTRTSRAAISSGPV